MLAGRRVARQKVQQLTVENVAFGDVYNALAQFTQRVVVHDLFQKTKAELFQSVFPLLRHM